MLYPQFPQCPGLSCLCNRAGYRVLYPGGNEDFMTGALPPPGTKDFINYFQDYQVNQLNGNNDGPDP